MIKKLIPNPIIIIAVFTLLVLAVGVVFIANQSKPKSPEKENLIGDYYPQVSREHIDPGAPHQPYNSNPPTSGQHYAQPANVGIYDNELPDEQLIHNLEHGHVWISYRVSSASAELVNSLKQIVKDNSRLVILTPREKNDSLIAVASWTRLLKLDNLDKQKIVDFIKTNRGHAPEFLP